MDSNKQPPRRRTTDLHPPTGSLQALEARMDALEASMDALEVRMDVFEAKLDANTELTETIIKLFATMEAGFKVLGWLGAAAKWFVTIAGAVGAVWAIMNGKNPK